MREIAVRRTSQARRGGRLRARVAQVRPQLYAADAAAVLVAGWGLTHALPGVLGGLDLMPLAAGAGVAAVLARLLGLHRRRLLPSVREDLPALVLVALGGTLTVSLLTDAPWMLGAGWAWHAGLLAAAVLLLAAGFRGVVHQLTRALRREGVLGQRVVIVDAGAEGSRLAETLLARRELGLRPVGMISSDSGRPARDLPLPLLGGMADLDDAMRDLGVDDVVFALPDLSDAGTLATVRRCVRDDRQVFLMPRSMPRSSPSRPSAAVDLVKLQRSDLRSRLQLPRRAADLVASAVALVLLLPVLLPAIIALRLEVGRGVLFRQTRISDSGRPFTLLKLRTTRPAVFDADATSWRIDNDTTVGPVGRLVRLTGVDELPQLLNVLRGEMRLATPWSARSDLVRELSR